MKKYKLASMLAVMGGLSMATAACSKAADNTAEPSAEAVGEVTTESEPAANCSAKPCTAKPCAAKPCAAKPCAAKPCPAKPCAAKPCAAKP